MDRNKSRNNLLFYFFFCWLGVASGQQGDVVVSSLNVKDQRVYQRFVFEGKDARGNSSGFINDLLLDEAGMLWLATNGGLIRWDGNKKLLFDSNKKNSYRLQSVRVNRIFESGEGDLVMETQGEKMQIELLTKGDTKTQKIELDQNGEKLLGYLVDVICTKDKEIYIVCKEGERLSIYLLEDKHFLLKHSIEIEKTIGQKKPRIAYSAGHIWLAVQGQGVWRFDEMEAVQVMSFRDLGKEKTIHPLFFHGDQNGRLWLGLSHLDANVFVWKQKSFVNYSTPLLSRTSQLKEGGEGKLFFIAGKYPNYLGEVYSLEKESWTNYSTYLDSSFMAVFPSVNNSNVFFGATIDNVKSIEIKEGTVKKYLKKEEFTNGWGAIIKGIQEDLDGNMYFLEEVRKFHKLDKLSGEIREISVKEAGGSPLEFQCGGAIHRDELGLLWFKVCDGSGKGSLVRFNPKTEQFKFFHFSEVIRDIDIGTDREIWLTHHSLNDRQGKLSRFDIEKEQFYPIDLGVSFAEPRYCYLENDSMLWLGTISGLVGVNTKRNVAEIFTIENSLLGSDRIIAIEKGNKGQLMLGTHGYGLQVFDPETGAVTAFKKGSGLPDNNVCGILPIGENRYWLTTFNGLSYFDLKTKYFSNYDTNDGFTDNEFNRYAFCQTKDGTNYLGTINGANAFLTEDFAPDFSKSQMALSSIKRYYGTQDSTDVAHYNLEKKLDIVLPPNLTYVEFDFYQTDFLKNKQEYFYAKLSPFDSDWMLVDGKKKLRYRRLPPGTYKLEVKLNEAAKPLKLTLVSKAPFYKTIWFNLSVLAFGLGFIIFVAKHRIKEIRIEEQNRERINRQMSELELSALRAQMNPHFVFNALGAIQYFIQCNEVEAADNYLTRFAQLMRKYLDGSKEKVITLKDEVELLRIYTDLEKLRFEELFSVDIEVEKDLLIEDIVLPSMLIQPFLENAINHGLNERRDGLGQLIVQFYGNEEKLFCEIKDNGIGYENAKKNKRRGHKSRSMGILKEKVTALKKAGYMDIHIHSEKLTPNNQKFPGTRVLLTIKNLENENDESTNY